MIQIYKIFLYIDSAEDSKIYTLIWVVTLWNGLPQSLVTFKNSFGYQALINGYSVKFNCALLTLLGFRDCGLHYFSCIIP